MTRRERTPRQKISKDRSKISDILDRLNLAKDSKEIGLLEFLGSLEDIS